MYQFEQTQQVIQVGQISFGLTINVRVRSMVHILTVRAICTVYISTLTAADSSVSSWTTAQGPSTAPSAALSTIHGILQKCAHPSNGKAVSKLEQAALEKGFSILRSK